MTDQELMGAALREARIAADLGEVPVGAVVARRGEIVAAAHNTRETQRNALHHAELLAIDAACKALGGWRLWECELFVTLEPCPMCAGAIVNSRIRRVVYGAPDPKAGCCGSVTDLFALPFNHHPWWSRDWEPKRPRPCWRNFSTGSGPSGGKSPNGPRRPAPESRKNIFRGTLPFFAGMVYNIRWYFAENARFFVQKCRSAGDSGRDGTGGAAAGGRVTKHLETSCRRYSPCAKMILS